MIGMTYDFAFHISCIYNLRYLYFKISCLSLTFQHGGIAKSTIVVEHFVLSIATLSGRRVRISLFIHTSKTISHH